MMSGRNFTSLLWRQLRFSSQQLFRYDKLYLLSPKQQTDTRIDLLENIVEHLAAKEQSGYWDFSFVRWAKTRLLINYVSV